MSLKRYNELRNFEITPEPEGKIGHSLGELKFAVHKHVGEEANYLLFFEVGGFLATWILPEKPVLNPSVRWHAERIENHPLTYLNFEGKIPIGNHFPGEEIIWDRGTYHIPTTKSRYVSEKVMAEELERGVIKIFLEGTKLKGLFSLVQIEGEPQNWLFFKNKDAFSSNKAPSI